MLLRSDGGKALWRLSWSHDHRAEGVDQAVAQQCAGA